MAALTYAADDLAGPADDREITVGPDPVLGPAVPGLVDPDRLAALCGHDEPDGPHIAACEIADGIVRGYTREGWPADTHGRAPREVRMVALAVALRLVHNLAGWTAIHDGQTLPGDNGGSRTYRREGGFHGLLLHETLILDRWRRRSG